MTLPDIIAGKLVTPDSVKRRHLVTYHAHYIQYPSNSGKKKEPTLRNCRRYVIYVTETKDPKLFNAHICQKSSIHLDDNLARVH